MYVCSNYVLSYGHCFCLDQMSSPQKMTYGIDRLAMNTSYCDILKHFWYFFWSPCTYVNRTVHNVRRQNKLIRYLKWATNFVPVKNREELNAKRSMWGKFLAVCKIWNFAEMYKQLMDDFPWHLFRNVTFNNRGEVRYGKVIGKK